MKTPNKNLARRLRKETTWAEKKLWHYLRNRKLEETKFRRQQSFGPYVLDFYCPERKLNIEIDGGQHDFPEHRIHDERRQKYLQNEGVSTLRFWNSQIREDMEGVLRKIRGAVQGE